VPWLIFTVKWIAYACGACAACLEGHDGVCFVSCSTPNSDFALYSRLINGSNRIKKSLAIIVR
jgi:D-arabinose 1-dehydrogenase-like Zn-dependent alcohol dehydrogenase